MVILVTGKQGAGKTHHADLLANELMNESNDVYRIDGDSFRELTGNNDYTDAGRIRNLMDAAQLAAEYEKKGYIVILSFIAPVKAWRDAMRKAWLQSRLIYIPGGKLWEGTTYERPIAEELEIQSNY